MRDMDNNAHSVYLLYYHLVMVVKYRRKNILRSEKSFGKRLSGVRVFV